VYFLLKEFKLSLKSSLISTQSFCHTISPGVGVGVWFWARVGVGVQISLGWSWGGSLES